MNTRTVTEGEIQTFQEHIFSWWTAHKRDLPWRKTHDPYKILVSELMLQQTQVSRVLTKYDEFLQIFPDVFALSKASIGDVLRVWKGMGYNRRALYLKKMAESIVEQYGGVFPREEKLLLELPGIGKYTVRAVLVFAYRQDIAMVDTNIRKIVIYHFFEGKPQHESVIQSVADQLVPIGKSWDWHQALMDYGSLELKKINPKSVSKLSRPLPFRESNRFFRGRVVDYLREKPWKEQTLVKEMVTIYGRDKKFMDLILSSLTSEGLIQRSKTGIISLPR